MMSTDLGPNPVPTYGGDSVLTIPKCGDDESAELSKLAQAFMGAQFEADSMPEPERIEFVTARLKALESTGFG